MTLPAPYAVLERALGLVAPPGVRWGARPIGDADVGSLHPIEAAHVATAVPRRRREYATGRALLRQLLDLDGPIATRPDRTADLPPGVVGSLAHDDEFAVAAVASASRFRSLGIDIEPNTPLDEAVARRVLRPDEADLDAHLAFTLKEAVYKAWSLAGGRLLEHHEVRLDVSGQARHGVPLFHGTVVSTGTRISGCYTAAAGRWLALATMPTRSAPA